MNFNPSTTSGLRKVRLATANSSGRMDLVTAAGADNGMNWFINAGQRMLDDMLGINKATNKYIVEMPAGGQVISMNHCKAVQEVWTGVEGAYNRLIKRSSKELRETYGDNSVTLLGSPVPGNINIAYDRSICGSPSYYALLINALTPEQNKFPFTGKNTSHKDAIGLIYGDHYTSISVLLVPATDTALTVTIVGQFYSPDLVNDIDKSFWTEVYPHLLVEATCYQIESSLRNSEGMKDKMIAINMQLAGIDKQMALEESVDITALEG